ncbi:MAG: hypothetical protein LBL07_07335 [Tannerella sp.]|jgi:hypothetical protein|nr:hypothetical protein [Tannerella sp.]
MPITEVSIKMADGIIVMPDGTLKGSLRRYGLFLRLCQKPRFVIASEAKQSRMLLITGLLRATPSQ